MSPASPSADRAFVRAGVTRSLARFLTRYPALSGARLLAAAGIDGDALANPDALIRARLFIDLLEHAARETGDAALGVRYAAQVPWQDLGVLAHVVLHSATAGAALANACRYLAVQQNVGRGALEVTGDRALLVYTVTAPDIRAHTQHSEGFLAMCTRGLRDGLGDPTWAPRAVRFAHRAPRSAAEQERFFGAPVRYGEPHDALELAAADLRRPFLTADAALLPALVRHAEECLAKLRRVDDFRGAVRRLVIEALRGGDPSVEQVAARLGMSPRSVQRRLQALGQPFEELVAEARLGLSRRYLEDPSLSLTDAAFLLGYSDLSAFSRAFRRWTGQSALAFRRAAAG